MSKVTKEIVIKNSQGLHARPAAMLVQIASRYNSTVTLIKDGEQVNAKSIMGVLVLGAQQGTKIIVEAQGDDAPAVIIEIEKLLTQEG